MTKPDDSDRGSTWRFDPALEAIPYTCAVQLAGGLECGLRYKSRRALGSHQGRAHKTPEPRRRRLPRPAMTDPCGTCAQPFGKHFTTWDGSIRGAFAIEKSNAERERADLCRGFTIEWDGR